jgi:hypothetical protein
MAADPAHAKQKEAKQKEAKNLASKRVHLPCSLCGEAIDFTVHETDNGTKQFHFDALYDAFRSGDMYTAEDKHGRDVPFCLLVHRRCAAEYGAGRRGEDRRREREPRRRREEAPDTDEAEDAGEKAEDEDGSVRD